MTPDQLSANDLLTTPSSDSDQDHRSSFSSDSKFDLIDIPSDTLKDLPQEEVMARILLYWDDMMANVNKFAGMLQHFQNCTKAWYGIVYINEVVGGLTTSVQAGEDRCQTMEDSLVTSLRDHDSKFDEFAAEVGKGFKDILELINVLNDEQTYC